MCATAWRCGADAAASWHHPYAAQRRPQRCDRAAGLYLHINHCLVGVGDKRAGLEEMQLELRMDREQTVFIADVLNDLAVRPAGTTRRWRGRN